MLPEACHSDTTKNSVPYKKAEVMSAMEYQLLVRYLRNQSQHQQPSSTRRDDIVSKLGIPERNCKIMGRTYAVRRTHFGNSMIAFRNRSGDLALGSINTIWRHEHEGFTNIYVFVSLLEELSHSDQKHDPFIEKAALACYTRYDNL